MVNGKILVSTSQKMTRILKTCSVPTYFCYTTLLPLTLFEYETCAHLDIGPYPQSAPFYCVISKQVA